MSQEGVARNAFIVGLGNVGSRVLGLVREQVIAGLFGATAATDAFRVAFRVPLTLYDLLAGGMISAALVPVFSRYSNAQDKASQEELGVVASTMFNGQLLVSAALALLLGLLAPQVMNLLASGYDSPVREQASGILRLLLPALVFMCLSSVLTARLYARERFTLPAMAALAYNGGMLTGALFLSQTLGIASLAVGLVAGMLAQTLIQAPAFRGLAYQVRLSLGHPQVKEVLRLYLPVALGLVVSMVGVAIDTALASRTGEGGLAALGFATTLVQFPLGLVAAGVGAATLPIMSRYSPAGTEPPVVGPDTLAAQQADPAISLAAYKDALALALKLTLVTIVPATVGLALLRTPVVRLLFQRGAFDGVATQRTALAFLAYAPGLPAAALDQMLIYGYYARRQTLTPVLVGVASVGVYLLVALALLERLGMPALAIANSAQWGAHAALMGILTLRAVGRLEGVWAALGRTLLASAAMGGVLTLLNALLGVSIQTSAVSLTLLLGLTVAAGALTYIGALALVGRDELGLLAGALRRKRPTDEP